MRIGTAGTMAKAARGLVAGLALLHGGASASPPVERALTRWLNAIAAAKAQPMPRLASAVERELYRRQRIDNAARNALDTARQGLSAADRATALQMMWSRLAAIDLDNLAYVKSVLPADGWFRRSRDGEIAASAAWLIVHHAEDWDFKRRVLAAMAPLVAIGEARGTSYALLHDRVALHDGKPQRYGSQAACRGGRWVLDTVEAPDGLDARRAAIGLEPITDYLTSLTTLPGCG